MDEKEAEKKLSLKNEKRKANRASETEEQRKERLRIRPEQKGELGKEKVIRHRRPQEKAPDHSQKIEANDENELERKLRRSKKEKKDWRMIQLPNGSGSPWRPMKKEKQDRRNGSNHRAQVGPGDRGRKKSKRGMDFIWL